MRHIGVAGAIEFQFPSPANHSAGSAFRSNVPAVSTENATIFLYGREAESRFLPVMRCTSAAISRLLVKITPSRKALNEPPPVIVHQQIARKVAV